MGRTKIEKLRTREVNYILVFKAGAAKPHRSLTQKHGRYPQ